jgi:hypothetical protein
MVIPILMTGGFLTLMVSQMLSPKMKVNGMIQTMMDMVTTSNISMVKPGVKLGEATVV